MARRHVAPVSSMLIAALSSACCWLPLVALGLGVSVGSAAAVAERFRAVLLVLAFVTLAAAFYLEYRRSPVPSDGCCPPRRRFARRLNRAGLWVSTALVTALALFPTYVGGLVGAPAGSVADVRRSESRVLKVRGMTCAGCEATVTRALEGVPGVRREIEPRGDEVALLFGAARIVILVHRSGDGAQLHGHIEQDDLREPVTFTRSGKARLSDTLLALERAVGGEVIALSSDGAQLRERFNADRAFTRLVLLLAPS